MNIVSDMFLSFLSYSLCVIRIAMAFQNHLKKNAPHLFCRKFQLWSAWPKTATAWLVPSMRHQWPTWAVSQMVRFWTFSVWNIWRFPKVGAPTPQIIQVAHSILVLKQPWWLGDSAKPADFLAWLPGWCHCMAWGQHRKEPNFVPAMVEVTDSARPGLLPKDLTGKIRTRVTRVHNPSWQVSFMPHLY